LVKIKKKLSTQLARNAGSADELIIGQPQCKSDETFQTTIYETTGHLQLDKTNHHSEMYELSPTSRALNESRDRSRTALGKRRVKEILSIPEVVRERSRSREKREKSRHHTTRSRDDSGKTPSSPLPRAPHRRNHSQTEALTKRRSPEITRGTNTSVERTETAENRSKTSLSVCETGQKVETRNKTSLSVCERARSDMTADTIQEESRGRIRSKPKDNISFPSLSLPTLDKKDRARGSSLSPRTRKKKKGSMIGLLGLSPRGGKARDRGASCGDKREANYEDEERDRVKPKDHKLRKANTEHVLSRGKGHNVEPVTKFYAGTTQVPTITTGTFIKTPSELEEKLYSSEPTLSTKVSKRVNQSKTSYKASPVSRKKHVPPSYSLPSTPAPSWSNSVPDPPHMLSKKGFLTFRSCPSLSLEDGGEDKTMGSGGLDAIINNQTQIVNNLYKQNQTVNNEHNCTVKTETETNTINSRFVLTKNEILENSFDNFLADLNSEEEDGELRALMHQEEREEEEKEQQQPTQTKQQEEMEEDSLADVAEESCLTQQDQKEDNRHDTKSDDQQQLQKEEKSETTQSEVVKEVSSHPEDGAKEEMGSEVSEVDDETVEPVNEETETQDGAHKEETTQEGGVEKEKGNLSEAEESEGDKRDGGAESTETVEEANGENCFDGIGELSLDLESDFSLTSSTNSETSISSLEESSDSDFEYFARDFRSRRRSLSQSALTERSNSNPDVVTAVANSKLKRLSGDVTSYSWSNVNLTGRTKKKKIKPFWAKEDTKKLKKGIAIGGVRKGSSDNFAVYRIGPIEKEASGLVKTAPKKNRFLSSPNLSSLAGKVPSQPINIKQPSERFERERDVSRSGSFGSSSFGDEDENTQFLTEPRPEITDRKWNADDNARIRSKELIITKKVEQLVALKELLKRLVQSGKKFLTEGDKYGRQLRVLGAFFEQMGEKEKAFSQDSLFAEALSQFGDVEKQIAQLSDEAYGKIEEEFWKELLYYVNNDLTQIIKVWRVKLEKSRRNYHISLTKLATLQRNNKTCHDVMKLFHAEKEIHKAKKVYECTLDLCIEKYQEIEDKKSSDLIHWVSAVYHHEAVFIKKVLDVMVLVEPHLNELLEWCLKWREIHESMQACRSEVEAHNIKMEEANFHVPLVTAINKHPQLKKLLESLLKDKGVKIEFDAQSLGIVALHSLVRENFVWISNQLLCLNRKEAVNDLCSALGLLEKRIVPTKKEV